MAAYGLYTHIRANQRRSVALFMGLFFLVYVLVFAGALIGEAFTHGDASLDSLLRKAGGDMLFAAPVATLATAGWVWVAYRWHQTIIDAMTGGRTVTRQDAPRPYNLLENLCISRGITMPTLKVTDESALNAFATGLNDTQYSITVTQGLVDALDDAELEAVLGHELTHIRNGDVRLLVIAVVIAGVVSFFGELVFRIVFQSGFSWRGNSSSRSSNDNRDRKGGGAAVAIGIAILLIVVSWLMAILIRFALSRQREFLADSGSVELTKNPDAMIGALRKIEGRGELPVAASGIMEMCVDNPRHGFTDLFATHPSIDKRIGAIMKFAGGHDPGPIAALPTAAAEADEPSIENQGQSPLPIPADPSNVPTGAATWNTAGPALVLPGLPQTGPAGVLGAAAFLPQPSHAGSGVPQTHPSSNPRTGEPV